jgi:D-alanine-D-alanine ligase
LRSLRIMVLMHSELMPPDTMEGYTDEEILEWKTEFDVLTTLQAMGHDARPFGVTNSLQPMDDFIQSFRPHITFNLLEEFDSNTLYDSHVVSYLILRQQKFTGCNPRGLMLSHDKVLCKQILGYHGVSTPGFCVYPIGRAIRKPSRLNYPLFVKSATEDASNGLSHRSIVHDEIELTDRVLHIHEEVGTDALCEEYIDGRELYVGVLGNSRLNVFPTWELKFDHNPDEIPLIATREAKWDADFQQKFGVMTYPAADLTPDQQRHISRMCRQIYRVLSLSGYARIDLRMNSNGELFVLEANPNPNLSYGEDFSEAADAAGIEYEDLMSRILNLGLRYDPSALPTTLS